MFLWLVLVALIALYWAPTYLAWELQCEHFWHVALVNLLVGWTIHWLGGGRGNGVARQADSRQPIRSSRAPILKDSERPRIPWGSRCRPSQHFCEVHGMRMREDPPSLVFPSGVLRLGLRLWSPRPSDHNPRS